MMTDMQKSGLTTLETRRLRGDLIEIFKIFKGFDDINYKKNFNLSSIELRGHDFKLYKSQVNLDVRKYFFSNRVIDIWNSLPVSLLHCNIVDTFKKKMTFLKVRGYK